MTILPPIAQETFDQIVRENIEDLDLEPEEAVIDAVEQLTTQKANLLYIIIEHIPKGETDHKVAVLTKKLENGDVSVCAELTKELKSDDLPKRYYACKKANLHQVLEKIFEKQAPTEDILKLAVATFDGQPDWATNTLINKTASYIENFESIASSTLLQYLLLISVISKKHENHRTLLFNCGVLTVFGKIVAQDSLETAITVQVCKTIRKFLVDDDPRETSCRAHDNARTLVTDENALLNLTKQLNQTDDDQVSREIVITISKLLVRNEFCQQAADDCKLLDTVSNILANDSNSSCLRPVLLLLKAM